MEYKISIDGYIYAFSLGPIFVVQFLSGKSFYKTKNY